MNNNPFEQLVGELLANAVPGKIEQSIASGLMQGAMALLSNPQAQESLNDLFNPCHTALDVAQDALDACDRGRLSHEAAMKIVAIALADDQARKLKRA